MLYYEKGNAEGKLAQDTVCLADDVCVDDMLFVSVHTTSGMNLRLNGVLGLSPGSSTVRLVNG